MDNAGQFRLEVATYDLMQPYTEFTVVFGGKETHCVGGIELKHGKFTFWQDFFKKCEQSLFRDDSGKFRAKSTRWDESNSCVVIDREDGELKVYCRKPRVNFDVGIKLEDIWSLYSEKTSKMIADNEETREIDGTKYYVVNPARIACVPEKFRKSLRKLFGADNFKNIPLEIFYTYDDEHKKFYMGLWNVLEHKPVNEDMSGVGNTDLSYIYDLQ